MSLFLSGKKGKIDLFLVTNIPDIFIFLAGNARRMA
jgi:hypothetical protein